MGYWTSKVLPKIKKVFDKNGKKAAAVEACKSFDDSKEEINKEFEEKKTDLQTKVVEIYEASSTEIKTLVKDRKILGVKKHSAAVQKFLEELSKIEFPGSKKVCEASTSFGPVLVSGPILFIFEKVSTFVITKEEEIKERELPAEEVAAAAATATDETTTTITTEEIITENKDKEKVIEEGSSEPTETKDEPAKTEVVEPAKTEVAEPAKCEEVKTEVVEPEVVAEPPKP